jgi:heat shock protein HslJ
MFTYLRGKLNSLSNSQTGGVDVGKDLSGTSWVWQKTEMNDDSLVNPGNDKFVLSFKSDGTIHSETDCNVINGSYGYNASKGQLTFEKLFQTKKLCPDSQEEKYVSELQSVEKVSFSSNLMFLQLKLDGGTMSFKQK